MTSLLPRPGLFLCLVVAVLTACTNGAKDPGPRTSADTESYPGSPVVLISIDTLRSDRLPAYGYDGVQTPALDRLRGDGILFEHVYSPVPLTLPAHVSLFSGDIPPGHGVHDNMGYRFEPTRGGLSLTRALRELGYETGGFISAFVLRGSTGMSDGFDVYEDAIEWKAGSDMGGMQRTGDVTLARALAWLDGVGDEPFFLFLHLYEPHSPYTPPEPWASRYEDDYDGEIAAADAVVGRLLEALDARGEYDDSLVVLLSDHGEGLNDHGEQEHGLLLYREALQVPLMVKLPGSARAGEARPERVSLADVAPTILSLLGQEPPKDIYGVPLLGPEARPVGERAIYGETQYPRLHFGWSPLRSAIEGKWHLIEGPESAELYDLDEDPAETRDRVRDERREAAALRDALQAVPSEVAAPAAEDEGTRRQLEALGYVGLVGTGEDEDLPHPKTRLHVLETLHEAYDAYQRGEYAKAIPIFRATLEEEPRLVDAWEHLGHCLMQSGDAEGAWQAYHKAMEYSGGAPPVALSAASALFELGRLDEARKHAEIALPTQPFAHAILARIELAEGRLDRAREEAREALRVAAGREDEILLLLAEIETEAGNPAAARDALRELQSSLGDRPPPRGFHVLEGQALASLGEAEAAERAFRAAIAQNPDELAAYTRLALLAALGGDAPGALQALRSMVEANPQPHAYAEAVRTLDALGDPPSADRLLAYARQRWAGDPELEALAASRAASDGPSTSR